LRVSSSKVDRLTSSPDQNDQRFISSNRPTFHRRKRFVLVIMCNL